MIVDFGFLNEELFTIATIDFLINIREIDEGMGSLA
jgi:hypothetical protein